MSPESQNPNTKSNQKQAVTSGKTLQRPQRDQRRQYIQKANTGGAVRHRKMERSAKKESEKSSTGGLQECFQKEVGSLKKSDCQSRRSNSWILERGERMERNQIHQEKHPAPKIASFQNKGAQRAGKTLDENRLQGISLHWVFCISHVITRFTSYYCFLESTSESHHSHGYILFHRAVCLSFHWPKKGNWGRHDSNSHLHKQVKLKFVVIINNLQTINVGHITLDYERWLFHSLFLRES